MSTSSNLRNSANYSTTSVPPTNITHVELPVQVVEKPAAIHEEIRRELVEEVQPVINVEKYKTEVHQRTQPLIDKEVKPVHIENRTLPTQILREVVTPTVSTAFPGEVNTVREMNTQTMTVEKQPIIVETDKRQVIEEIQPVIYKETVVPTIIKETKPVYQRIVEGTTYQTETMAPRTINVSQNNTEQNRSISSNVPIIQPTHTHVDLPVQIVEKPAAIHEEIRREFVEEIQPVINVEKIRTEVVQKTQPLMDKEVRPVFVEQRTLAREILPEVVNRSVEVPLPREVNTVRELGTQSTVVEKPAIFNETERRQVIEEIQPVIYKETVVPTLIRETKPVYQKIIEGTTYSHQTLPPMPLSGSHYANAQPQSSSANAQPQSSSGNVQPQSIPLSSSGNVQPQSIPLSRSGNVQPNPQFLEKDVTQTTTRSSNIPFQPSIPIATGFIQEKIVTTTTTTTNSPYTPI
jgi:rubrerythrin